MVIAKCHLPIYLGFNSQIGNWKSAMPLLISELDDQRHLSIALHICLNLRHVQDDRIAGLEPTQYSLKIRERRHWSTIYTIDYVAFVQHWLTRWVAQFRYEPARIDVLDVKTLDTSQVAVSKQLRCQFGECNAKVQCIAFWIVGLGSRAGWCNPFARR